MPPHLRNDEAALGYNAYSILKTARDEHGQFLPIIFQSFGDWKLGGYIYLTVPFVALFGLNELAVRLPSAISGIISVWLMFEIILFIFANKKLALISSLLFAISPLYVVFSRGAWEVNVSLALTLTAIFFFLKSLSKSRYLIFSSIFFGLTLFTSHTAKLSSPIILLLLLLAFYKKLKVIPIKYIFISILIGLIFTFPIIFSFIEGKVARITTVSIFSYYDDPKSIIQSVVDRLFNLYSGSTLFIRGDGNPQHTPPNTGPFLFIDVILFVFGVISLLKKGTRVQNFFIWSLLFLLSLPSVLTIEKINLERILPEFIPMILIVALGASYLWDSLSKYKKKFKIILPFILLLYLINYGVFFDEYFVHGSKKNDAWQYGYKQIVEKSRLFKDKQIIVQQSLEQPYIFFLFYQQYDPRKYQSFVNDVFIPNKEGKDMGLVSRIDNISFKYINWLEEKPRSRIIYIMPTYKLKEQSKYDSEYEELDEVKDPNGFSLLKIVKTI